MLNPKAVLRRLSGKGGAVGNFLRGPSIAAIGIALANRANVDRLKPMLQKRNTIEARAIATRMPSAASMTDQELDDALAQNWTEGLGWEVTRRIMVQRLADWRATEPADDMETAASEAARGV